MTKATVLIDGGFFLKRLPRVRSDIDVQDAKEDVGAVNELAHMHLAKINDVPGSTTDRPNINMHGVVPGAVKVRGAMSIGGPCRAAHTVEW